MSDDRASRLRSRRGKARERREEQRHDNEASEVEPTTADTAEPAAESGAVEEDATETEKTENEAGGDAGSVKDERVGTYMYLPESQKRELERVYGTLKVQYEYEFDEEFEKNRHFFPAVVRHGLETLDGMDATEVRAVVEEL